MVVEKILDLVMGVNIHDGYCKFCHDGLDLDTGRMSPKPVYVLRMAWAGPEVVRQRVFSIQFCSSCLDRYFGEVERVKKERIELVEG